MKSRSEQDLLALQHENQEEYLDRCTQDLDNFSSTPIQEYFLFLFFILF